MKAKTRHFPITDFGWRGGLNVPFNLSKIVVPARKMEGGEGGNVLTEIINVIPPSYLTIPLPLQREELILSLYGYEQLEKQLMFS